jgi:hypothetical protein
MVESDTACEFVGQKSNADAAIVAVMKNFFMVSYFCRRSRHIMVEM